MRRNEGEAKGCSASTCVSATADTLGSYMMDMHVMIGLLAPWRAAGKQEGVCPFFFRHLRQGVSHHMEGSVSPAHEPQLRLGPRVTLNRTPTTSGQF